MITKFTINGYNLISFKGEIEPMPKLFDNINVFGTKYTINNITHIYNIDHIIEIDLNGEL